MSSESDRKARILKSLAAKVGTSAPGAKIAAAILASIFVLAACGGASSEPTVSERTAVEATRGGAVGSEIVGPMAVVLLGGLVTTTLVNLVVLPALYLRFGSVADEDAAEDLFIVLPDVDTVGER